MDAYWQTPPLARTLATAAFVTSMALFMGFVNGYWFYFAPDLLFKIPPQIWRIATNFLITGPNLSLLFDPYFLYTYLSALEVGNPRFSRREDLIWYLMFVCTVITVSLLHRRCPLLAARPISPMPKKTKQSAFWKVPPHVHPPQSEHRLSPCLLHTYHLHLILSARIVDTHSYSGSWK
ncbi:DER1-domain-containing protein [Colletotrichum zoysiae]|uniref:Derlin n=1 Tax=Colletotrichum zoysiae TaxID=1216348 RepID=A0AAD9LXQ4_9PEZI|nr:DER1-domain-containing protein [Colletotrichum zoysiae]